MSMISRDEFPYIGRREWDIDPTKDAQLLSISTLRANGKKSSKLYIEDALHFSAEILVNHDINKMMVSFMIHDNWSQQYVSATHTALYPEFPIKWKCGRYGVDVEFPQGIINCGEYYLRGGLGWKDEVRYDYHEEGLGFSIISHDEIEPHSIHSHGMLAIIPQYTLKDYWKR